MISRLLATRLFEAFSIQRWNDRIRPSPITEMDKQGFKSVLTFVFAKIEEDKGHKIDWDYLIHASVFALLKNIALSDIKATVLSRVKKEHPESYKQLNKWVVDQFRPIIDDNDLLERFSAFLSSPEEEDNINLRIVRAAHKYSTYREFELIKSANASNPQLEHVEKRLNEDIMQYLDLHGLKEVYTKQSLFEAVCTIEQLRFQTRWSQTPRIPMTSVLGHSMLVAVLMLFFSRQLSACDARLYNNFFGGLFHDLPEAVVRDIVSPVKRATSSLPDIVRQIEAEVTEEELFSQLPESITEDLKYFTGFSVEAQDEFSDRIKIDGQARVMGDNESIDDFNDNKYSPLDGTLIKLADEIGAFLEANQSIEHGVTSRHLVDGMSRIRFKYLDIETVRGIDLRSFFLSFD